MGWGVHSGVLWSSRAAARPRPTLPSSLAAETLERQRLILHLLASFRKGLCRGGQRTELLAPRFCPSFFPLLGWGMGPAWLVMSRGLGGGGVGQRWGSCQASDSRAPHRLRRTPGTAVPSNLTDGVWPWPFPGCPGWVPHAAGTTERPWRTCVNKAKT